MAEKVAFSIEVDGVQKTINSIKELKTELKAAQSAALNGDGKAAKRVAELKDRMDDLKDATGSLAGTSIEKGNKAINNLGEGFRNLDIDKLKLGFKGLGAAMSATGIMLLVQGVTYLIENFDELSKGSGFLATILQGVGNAISWIKNGITDLIGVTDEHTRAVEAQGEAIAKNAEQSKEKLNETTAAFDRQIAVAKANGKSTVELEKAKQQAIIDTNLAIAKSIEAYVRAGGELDDEKKKMLSGSLEAIKGAKVQEYVITETDNKAKQEQYKKHLEEQQKIKDQYAAIDKKFAAEQKRIEKEAQAADDAEQLALKTQRDALNKQMLDQKHAEQIAADNAEVAAFQEKEKKKEALEKATVDNGFNNTKEGLEAAQMLSDIFFAHKLNSVKKGSAEELKLAKQQFNINKAFQISQATIDGLRATLGTYAATSEFGPEVSIPATIAAGVLSAATIAKIASTQFQGGGSASVSGGETSAPTISQGSTRAPSLSPPSNQPSTTFTGNKNDQYNNANKVFVVETDIRHSSKRIDTLVEQSTY